MTIVGLTGSFGAGKTFTASIFRGLGAKIIDADKLAAKALLKGSPAYKKAVALFGADIADKDGGINRRRLADIVFDSPDNLTRLNEIVHPEVIKEIKREIKKTKGVRAIIIDAPLLIEAGLLGLVDKLVVVRASKINQVKRGMKKFGIKRADVLKRIAGQMPLEEKVKLADFVVDNDGAKSNTRKQVERIWEEILWR